MNNQTHTKLYTHAEVEDTTKAVHRYYAEQRSEMEARRAEELESRFRLITHTGYGAADRFNKAVNQALADGLVFCTSANPVLITANEKGEVVYTTTMAVKEAQ